MSARLTQIVEVEGHLAKFMVDGRGEAPEGQKVQ